MPLSAAQPITINFEDIFNKPFGQPLPTFLWRGVRFSGGGLYQQEGVGTFYRVNGRSSIDLEFPPGSTEISFKAEGRGTTIRGERMRIEIRKGQARTGELVATLPFPASTNYVPPGNTVTIPGSASLVTLFTEPAPLGTDEVFNEIVIDDIRYTPPDPEPTITFDTVLPQHTRVLTHNYGAYPYPSPLQSTNASVRVNATVSVNGQPAPNKTIHFRLIDPPDTSDYVVHAGDSTYGDNADGPGKLNGQAGATATSDAAGRVAVTLNVTTFAAGDNYQIEASGTPSFSCGLTCAKSATFTAWKRIYVEYNKMFRRGAFLRDLALTGERELRVDDARGLPDAPFQVRLLHANAVDAPGGGFATNETVRVVKVQKASSGFFSSNPVLATLLLDPNAPGLSRDYLGPEEVKGTDRPYLADAVGVVTGDREEDFFLANGTLLNDLMDQAFVEYIWLSDASPSDPDLLFTQPKLPYDGVFPRAVQIGGPDLQQWQKEWMARKWLRHATRQQFERVADANHHALFTMARFWSPVPLQNDLGRTKTGSGFSDSWIAIAATGGQARIAENVAHELAHQWLVNRPGPNPAANGGHCGSIGAVPSSAITMAGSATRFCVMTADIFNYPEAGAGTINFHYKRFGAVVDSEYLRIRRRLDPMPQNEEMRLPPE